MTGLKSGRRFAMMLSMSRPTILTTTLAGLFTMAIAPLSGEDLHGTITRSVTPALLVREIPNPTRAALDWAAWQNNPLLAMPDGGKLEGQNASPSLDEAGRFEDAIAPETATDVLPHDLPMPVVWDPFVEWLQRQDADVAAPFLDAAYLVSREKWGLRTVTQRIALLYFDGSGLAWIRVDFDPRLETAAGLSDSNGDGAAEFYAQLAADTGSAALLFERYMSEILDARALDIYFNELAAAWYDNHYVFARDPAGFTPFPGPTAGLAQGDAEALSALSWNAPSAVIERPAETDEGRATAGRYLVVFRAGTTTARKGDGAGFFSPPQRLPAQSRISHVLRVSDRKEPGLTAFSEALAAVLQSTTEDDRIVPGREPGVLFLRRGLEYLAAQDLAVQETPPVPVLVDFAAQLKERNIQFVFMPIPVKAAVYPDWFAEPPTDPAPNTAGRMAFEELRVAGVEVLDPAPVLRAARSANSEQLLYLRTDTHWTPAGAMLAADWLAKELARLGLERGSNEYTTAAQEIVFKGNLARMLPEDEQARMPPERHTAVQVLEENGQPFSDRDPEAQVIVLGDSYLTIYQREQCGAAGFAAHLAKALGQPVDLIANQGGGPQTRIDFARRIAASSDYLAGKRFVVLAMSERDLYRPFGGWKMVQLP